MSCDATSEGSRPSDAGQAAGVPDVEQLRRAYRGGEIVLQSSKALWTHGAGKAGSKALTKTLGKAALPLAAVDAVLSVRDAVLSHQAWKREELATQRLRQEVQALEKRYSAEELHLARQLEVLTAQVDLACAEIQLGLHRLDAAAAARRRIAERLDLLSAMGAPSAKVAEAARHLDRMTELVLAQLAMPLSRPGE